MVPIIFSQATPYQRQVLVRLIDKENQKLHTRSETLTKDDVVKLFDYLDEKNRGFLSYDDVMKAMETLQVRRENGLCGSGTGCAPPSKLNTHLPIYPYTSR